MNSTTEQSAADAAADNEHELAERIHNFWFGNDLYGAFPVEKVRFWHVDPSDSVGLNEQSDRLAYIEEHFLFLVKSACNGGLSEWQEEPRSCLTLILVLDQFAKRLLHNREYEKQSKAAALQYCRYGITQNLDKELTPIERSFFYGPLLYADKISLRTVGLQMLQNLLDDVSFKENPFHHHKNHLMVSLYHAVAHKSKAEKRFLSAIA